MSQEVSAPHSEVRLLWLLTGVALTVVLDFMLLMPLGPELMPKFGLTPATFASLVTSYSLASAIVSLAGAGWVSRLPRKAALLGAYAVFVAATLGCALATSATQLLCARLVAGASAGLTLSLVLATVIDAVPFERRGRALGTVMSAYAVSAVLGVPLGLLLASRGGFQVPFIALACAALALWSSVAWLGLDAGADLSPTGPDAANVEANAPESVDASVRALWRLDFLLGWSLTFVVACAGFLIIPFIGTFLVGNLHVSEQQLGLVYLCGGLCTFFSMHAVGHYVDVAGPRRILFVLLGSSMLAHLLLTHLASTSLALVIVSFVLFMTLTSGRQIPALALITASVPAPLRAPFMAINTAVVDLASGAGAWVGGLVLSTDERGALIGFERNGVISMSTSLAAIALVYWMSRRERQGAVAASGELSLDSASEPSNEPRLRVE